MTDSSAPLPSEGDYGVCPPPADEPLGLPADRDRGRLSVEPGDDGSIYGHTQDVLEPEQLGAQTTTPASGGRPEPAGMVKTPYGFVPEDTARLARRSQPWPLKEPNLLKGRERQPVEWVVKGLIPKGEVTLLSGHGGLGKSTMLIQLQVATRLGKPWLGLPTTKMRSLGIYCEDKDSIVDNRFNYAIEHYGANPAEIEEGLVWVVLRGGYHTYLCNFLPFSPKDEEEEPVVPSAAFGRLEQAIRQVKPGLIILDSLLKFFSGRMIDQLHVDGFYRACPVITHTHNI